MQYQWLPRTLVRQHDPHKAGGGVEYGRGRSAERVTAAKTDGCPECNPREEVQRSRQEHDPIEAFATRLLEAGLVDEQGLRQLDEQAQHEVEAAVQFAEESPDPSVEAFMSDLYHYVYASDETSLDVHEKED